jgi:AraC-like DNA-binding protein
MDKARLDGILEDFYTVTGMEISLLNPRFHTVSVRRSRDGSFCSYLHSAAESIDVCKASDKERLSEVEKSGIPIVYTCPSGITEAILPVIRGDAIIAYLICSMGIRESDRDRVMSLAMKAAPRLDTSELDEVISRVRVLTDREIEAHLGMISLVAEHISRDATLTENEESIGKLVKYYVRNNLEKKLTLADIALNLHCSTVTLTEHFKAEFGITIMEYVTKKRMDLAEKLLITTDEPLAEIAPLVGFSDVEYFSRTFKKYHGTSPAAWRRANK